MGRGLMGDGVIEIPRLREAVEATGYRGPIEVEIFNQQLWSQSADEIVEVVAKRFQEWVQSVEKAFERSFPGFLNFSDQIGPSLFTIER